MTANELERLRQISAQIKSAIGAAAALLMDLDDSPIKNSVGESVGDLWRASEILEARLRGQGDNP